MLSAQTLAIGIVTIILAVLMIAQSSVAIKESKAAKDTNNSNYQFSVAMLIISLVVLVGAIAYLAYMARSPPSAKDFRGIGKSTTSAGTLNALTSSL
jgi:K+-transporting ATPase A subunit